MTARTRLAGDGMNWYPPLLSRTVIFDVLPAHAGNGPDPAANPGKNASSVSQIPGNRPALTWSR
jgi:hypothetical protein